MYRLLFVESGLFVFLTLGLEAGMSQITEATNEELRETKTIASHRYVKDMGDRRIIFTFSGKDKMTDLIICYAERKASLRF